MGAARSKEDILAAAVHDSAWLGAGVLVASFLSALYAGRLALLAFGPGIAEHRGRSPGRSLDNDPIEPPPAVERWALGALAAATLALSALWLPGAAELVEGATGGSLVAGEAWELAASLATVALAGGLITLLYRRGRLATLALPERARARVAAWLGLPALARRVVVDPVLALSRILAAVDDRVVDAGVRAAVRVAGGLSRLLAWWGERGVDGLVQGVAAGLTLRTAPVSRATDERAVDRAVEQLARGTVRAGHQSRRLQSGLSHHYYVIVALGLVAVVAVATLGRS